jgi:hypothetical protein
MVPFLMQARATTAGRDVTGPGGPSSASKTFPDPRIGIVGAGDGSVSVFSLERATIMPPETLRGHGIRNHPWVFERTLIWSWRRQPPATQWLIVVQ